MLGTHAQHEADGVHEVALARPIRPDHRGEIAKGADGLVSRVGLEVKSLDAIDFTHREHESSITQALCQHTHTHTHKTGKGERPKSLRLR